MGSLKSRLEVLEDVRERGEAQLAREALRFLSDNDLAALEVVIEARDHGASGEDLYHVAGERGRRASLAFNEILSDLKEGKEPESRKEHHIAVQHTTTDKW